MAKRKSASHKTKNDCKKYGIAITNYVLGEDLGMTPEELYNHLRNCPQCLEELTDWQETYAVMRTEAYHRGQSSFSGILPTIPDSKTDRYKTPEAKKRYAELLEKIKNLPALSAEQAGSPGEQPIDDELVLGTAAEKVYNALKGNGKIAYSVLRKKADLLGEPFYESIGWLAKEKKIRRTRDEQTVYVSLTEREREAGLSRP